MHVKIVDVDSILELRHKVLRHGKPFESCFYEEDRIASTIHLAAFNKDTIVNVIFVGRRISTLQYEILAVY